MRVFGGDCITSTRPALIALHTLTVPHQMIRRRMLAILDDRETLREQLNEVPADGDPNAMAISIARVRGHISY